eukprot:TRINITY_DN8551_c5_g1_i1.p1 TRINITY_DN8551_c5_g1~~TRINITY_DN8551_c5_g1_i1.p1  ORF type:complete len:746 (+),score=217.43 TRINITY_DN8551_c5_g1_i1:78-2240(+)
MTVARLAAAVLLLGLAAGGSAEAISSAVGAEAGGEVEKKGQPRLGSDWTPLDYDGGKCPDDDDGSDDDGAADWVKKGGVVAIIFGILVSFWSLAVIVEEYFVPALNIMCERAKIPEDVAGATFMAAGASSPELFSAIISLFITHSALGAGTIVGSEIFNHLCICAGAIVYSKSGELLLEPRILYRECVFYALACGLLIFSMAEIGDSEGRDCKQWVYMRWYHGVILVGGYVLYALVCSNYKNLVPRFCPYPEDDEDEEEDGGEGKVPNIQGDAEAVLVTGARTTSGSRPRGASTVSHEPAANFVERSFDASPVERTRSAGAISNVLESVLPGLGPELDHSREVFMPGNVQCYIWKKSRFYNALYATTKTWQLRWAVIDAKGFRYFRDPDGGQGRAFNLYQDKTDVGSPRSPRSPRSRGDKVTIEITDARRNIFELVMPANNQKRVVFQAQNRVQVESIVAALEQLIAQYDRREGESTPQLKARRSRAWEEAQEEARRMSGEDGGEVGEHDHEPLIAWPRTTVGKVVHVVLFPFKAALHYTMVDVRGENKAKWWWLTCIVSVVWLAIMSYAMTFCVETLGKLMGISELVMGLTVSAAGTSFPNVFASMLVARQGLGNMAISNAFGSNVFNIFMGLGLPWFLICVLGNSDANVDDMVFHGMKQGGVAFPVIVLLVLLIGFLILLCFTGMRLYKIHAYIFTLMYVGFLVWAFAWSAKGPDLGI